MRYESDPQPQSHVRLQFERTLMSSGCQRFAGVDEAGRGPLAGPVVAAAVILPMSWIRDGLPRELRSINDSKKLTPIQREDFFKRLKGAAGVEHGVAMADASTIDAINILQATHHAMNQALLGLVPLPDHALVDGNPVPSLVIPQTALVKGDSRSYSIAAASILAKVTRDRRMDEADRRWPEYGFARHKGYPTTEHLEALRRHGPCPIHRRSFAPLRPVQSKLFLQ
ncbi:MAG: ribonuclease HII [Verrucomicrobiota bacterium]